MLERSQPSQITIKMTHLIFYLFFFGLFFCVCVRAVNKGSKDSFSLKGHCAGKKMKACLVILSYWGFVKSTVAI